MAPPSPRRSRRLIESKGACAAAAGRARGTGRDLPQRRAFAERDDAGEIEPELVEVVVLGDWLETCGAGIPLRLAETLVRRRRNAAAR
ncbi:MAG: hypothetical protein KIT31_39545 [Deltaproteobacteria bacterium]|nr:hypothetical protein [Deltaproteobacteria bacterium]